MRSQRDEAIGRGPHDFQRGIFRQGMRDQSANDHRIIHHQHAYAGAAWNRFPVYASEHTGHYLADRAVTGSTP